MALGVPKTEPVHQSSAETRDESLIETLIRRPVRTAILAIGITALSLPGIHSIQVPNGRPQSRNAVVAGKNRKQNEDPLISDAVSRDMKAGMVEDFVSGDQDEDEGHIHAGETANK